MITTRAFPPYLCLWPFLMMGVCTGSVASDFNAAFPKLTGEQIQSPIYDLEQPAIGPFKNQHRKYPRRIFVGSNHTGQYYVAQYLDYWVKKIEAVGNTNYPLAAKNTKLYGAVKLTVIIKSDGQVELIEIDRSSGSKILDEASINTIRLAQPFEPFGDELKKLADTISITKTWMYTTTENLKEKEVVQLSPTEATH